MIVGLVTAFLLLRGLFVPTGFGVHSRGYTYGWYNISNEDKWRALPVQYRSVEDCADCHDDAAASVKRSSHAIIACQNCHGPARGHPDAPERLVVDTSRELCARCHSLLPATSSGRADIVGIDLAVHNPGQECASCHDSHDPTQEAAQ
ncbi:MAG TPA: cytochrome c3 family protein [Deinococcales bacterium]|nr:cytochrome c3 family protein [Deinococcales bacterium]